MPTRHTADAGNGVAVAPSPSRAADLSDVIAAFREVTEAINEDMDLDAVLHIVARRICALFDVHRCSVYLKDDEAGLYRGRVGEPNQAWDEPIKRLTCGTEADRFTKEIVARKRPVLITDAQHDPRPIRSAMRAWDVRSMLGVPMVERGEVTGLIFLDNGDVPHVVHRRASGPRRHLRGARRHRHLPGAAFGRAAHQPRRPSLARTACSDAAPRSTSG